MTAKNKDKEQLLQDWLIQFVSSGDRFTKGRKS